MNGNEKLIEKNVIQINGGITISFDVSVKEILYVKNIVWNPATCVCKNGKYLYFNMDKTVCDEVINTEQTNFNEKIWLVVKHRVFTLHSHFYLLQLHY